MNKRQKKKRRKKNDAIIRELMRMTLEQMSPDDWKPPLMQSIFPELLAGRPKFKRGCPSLD